MIPLLIIISYILNVFLNRWLNYILYKKYMGLKTPTIWFFSIMGTIALLGCIIIEYFNKPNWFTGRDWDNIKKI
jgi:hypothetical protein